MRETTFLIYLKLENQRSLALYVKTLITRLISEEGSSISLTRTAAAANCVNLDS
jgi:hypothetical protein